MSYIPEKKLCKKTIIKWTEEMSFAPLRAYLDTKQLGDDNIQYLIDVVRRTLKFKRNEEHRRTTFISNLENYVSSRIGNDFSSQIAILKANFNLIELGYQSILKCRERSGFFQLTPDERASAILYAAAEDFCFMQNKIQEALGKPEKTLFLHHQGVPVTAPNGEEIGSLDSANSTIVNAVSSAILMESYENNWFTDNFVVLPNITIASMKKRMKARVSHFLAESWKQWKRVEERYRYFGGNLQILNPPFTNVSLPEECQKAIHVFSEGFILGFESLSFAADERLSSRIFGLFVMTSIYDIFKNEPNINEHIPLPPEKFISKEELISIDVIGNILGIDILTDTTRYENLTLLEWIRGYASLQTLSRKHFEFKGSTFSSAVWITSVRKLESHIAKLGLGENAMRLIENLSFKRSSRDLFDAPLIKCQNDIIPSFGPSLMVANIPLVILSIFSNKRINFTGKGKYFENSINDLLREKSLNPCSFLFRLNEEEFEYDCLFEWGSYIFLFECKNRALPGTNPIALHNALKETYASCNQIERLINALKNNPNIIEQNLGKNALGKPIIGCIVNALPFSFKGKIRECYSIDAAALKVFFSKKTIDAIQKHEEHGMNFIQHKPFLRIWMGNNPSPEDFLAYIENLPQLSIAMAHTEIVEKNIQLDEKLTAIVPCVVRKLATPESISKVCESLSLSIKKI